MTYQHFLDLAGYSFTAHSLPPALTAAAVLLLGLTVALRERLSRVSLAFLLLTLPLAIWFVGFTFLYAARTPEAGTRWANAILVAIPFIGPSVLGFTAAVLGKRPLKGLRIASAWLVGALLSLVAVVTGAGIDGLYSHHWGFYSKYTPFTLLLLGFTFVLVLLSLWHLHAASRTSTTKAQRTRAGMLALAFGVGSVGIVDSVPAYGIPLYPLGFLGITGFVAVCAWTVWRHRLIDITPRMAANNVLEALHDAVLVVDMDGVVQVANPAALRLLKIETPEPVGLHISTLMGGQFAGLVTQYGEGDSVAPFEIEEEIEGEDCILSVSSSALRHGKSAIAGMVYIIRDVTRQKQAENKVRTLNLELEEQVRVRTAQLEEANLELAVEVEERRRLTEDLRRSRDQLDVILHGVADGIVVQDTEGNVIFANAAGAQCLGVISLEALQGLPFEQVLGQFDLWTEAGEACSPARLPVLRALAGEEVSDEVLCLAQRTTGTRRWYILNATPVFDRSGQVQFAVSIFKEITDRKFAEQALRELSVRDELTGLYNRRELNRLLSDEADRFRRYQRPASLVLLDIDHFKLVNDTYGHQAGDAVLQQVAGALVGKLRSTDRIARFGGEEFAILMPETSLFHAIEVAEDLRLQVQSLRCEYEDPDGALITIPVTVSLGLATMSSEIECVESLVRAADTALYESKRNGRNRSTAFTTDSKPWEEGIELPRPAPVFDFSIQMPDLGAHD